MSNILPTVTEIAEKTWCISEFGLVNVYLVEGRDSAALIDTGCGIMDLAKIVRDLTAKPLKILLTHGHPDHNGGIYQFPDIPVFMKKEDEGIRKVLQATNPLRKAYIESRVPVRFPGVGHVEALTAMLPDPEPDPAYSYVDYPEDGIVDLGGRSLRVIPTPGHSEGSVCLLDETTGILFSGDTVSRSNILARQPANSMELVRQYHGSLTAMWEQERNFDVLAIGHDGVTIPKTILRDHLTLTTGLLSGSISGSYEEVGFRKGMVARYGMSELWYQCDA